MSSARPLAPSDWDGIRLVAFDVDGTLYSQRRLRLLMARDMVVNAALTRSLDALIVIKAYRLVRERLGELEEPDFDGALVAETAKASGRSTAVVRAIVDEWITRRPLAYLAACRYRGVAELFAGLRRRAKIIGIVSDYPAQAKLAALGVSADHVVCASDSGVGLLKPNPRGLEVLIEAAGVTARQTVLIGDRADRDGIAARRISAWPLIRSRTRIDGWQTFDRFDDALFKCFFCDPSAPPERAARSDAVRVRPG
jgi:putative hydrolase of the HAD superfamily